MFRAGPIVLKSTHHSEASLIWLDRVQARAERCGIAVPRMIRSRWGTLNTCGWTAEPFCPGPPASASDIQALAPAFARLHRSTVRIPLRPGQHRLLRGTPRSVIAQLDAQLAIPVNQRCAVHGDITPRNVVLGPNGPVVLDWDEARKDIPVFDTAQLTQPTTRAERKLAQIWEIAVCWRAEPQRARALARSARTGFVVRPAGSLPNP